MLQQPVATITEAEAQLYDRQVRFNVAKIVTC
jgi:hypothetical protein